MPDILEIPPPTEIEKSFELRLKAGLPARGATIYLQIIPFLQLLPLFTKAFSKMPRQTKHMSWPESWGVQYIDKPISFKLFSEIFQQGKGAEFCSLPLLTPTPPSGLVEDHTFFQKIILTPSHKDIFANINLNRRFEEEKTRKSELKYCGKIGTTNP